MATATISEHIAELADLIEAQPSDLAAIRALYAADDEHLVDYVAARVMRALETAKDTVSAQKLIVAELRELAAVEPPDAPDAGWIDPRRITA